MEPEAVNIVLHTLKSRVILIKKITMNQVQRNCEETFLTWELSLPSTEEKLMKKQDFQLIYQFPILELKFYFRSNVKF